MMICKVRKLSNLLNFAKVINTDLNLVIWNINGLITSDAATFVSLYIKQIHPLYVRNSADVCHVRI